jgi:hypothetical protein
MQFKIKTVCQDFVLAKNINFCQCCGSRSGFNGVRGSLSGSGLRFRLKFLVIKTLGTDWIRIRIHLKCWVRIHNTDFCLQSNIIILQKNGAGLHTASSCYWDNSTDGSCTVRKSFKHFITRIIIF